MYPLPRRLNIQNVPSQTNYRVILIFRRYPSAEPIFRLFKAESQRAICRRDIEFFGPVFEFIIAVFNDTVRTTTNPAKF